MSIKAGAGKNEKSKRIEKSTEETEVFIKILAKFSMRSCLED